MKYAIQTVVHFTLFVLALVGVMWFGFFLQGPESLRPPGADEPQISMNGVEEVHLKKQKLPGLEIEK